jgi:hypothetical protein
LLDRVADNVLLDSMFVTFAAMRVPEPPILGAAGDARPRGTR